MILLIEGCDALFGIRQQAVELGGCCRVAAATDGLAALNRVRTQFYCLAMTDLAMPWKESMETIMAPGQQCSVIKVITMSGGSLGNLRDSLAMAGKLGAFRLLEKPFGCDVLLAAVEEVLDA